MANKFILKAGNDYLSQYCPYLSREFALAASTLFIIRH